MGRKRDRRPSNSAAVTANTEPTSNPFFSFKYILAATILVAGSVFVYVPSLKVPFLLDDYGKIIRNPDIKSLDNIPSRLIYPYESPPAFHRNDPSRPLTFLSLTLNYHFNQLEPYGYHIVNIAFHVVVVLLVLVLASLVFSLVGVKGSGPPFLAALIFAVHPININVVTYVMGRAASLATIFYVSAVILFIMAERGFKWGMVVSAACFIFALGSNQLTMTLPAVILMTDFCFFGEGGARRIAQNWKQHGVYWGILVFYLGLRLAYFGKIGDVEASVLILNRTEYFLTEWVVLWRYAGMLLWPTGLSFEHLFGPLTRLSDPSFLSATALYGVLFAVLIKGFKSWRPSALIFIFGVTWFLITISPTSSVFPTTATIAENRVYLPAIGLCLIIPFAVNGFLGRVCSSPSQRPILLLLLSAYACGLGVLTYNRNILYQDPVRLWSDVIQKYPNHQRAHKNLALAFFSRGNFEQMAAESEKAVALDPGDYDARSNLASAYYNLKRYPEALEIYKEIVKEKPDHAAAYSNMGLTYEQLNDKASAINSYRNAIRLNPMLIEPLNNLGGLYLEKGLRKEAAEMFQAALRIDPHNPQILRNYERVMPPSPKT